MDDVASSRGREAAGGKTRRAQLWNSLHVFVMGLVMSAYASWALLVVVGGPVPREVTVCVNGAAVLVFGPPLIQGTLRWFRSARRRT